MKRRSLKATLQARRAYNRALAAKDRANRCANPSCQRPFAESGSIIESFLDPGKFCSEACLHEASEGRR